MTEEFKLFIRNIPYTSTDAELHSALESVPGYVSSSINKDSNTGDSRGNGIIVLDSRENGFALLNNNNIVIGDRRVKFLKFINKNKQNTLFVTGLEKGTSSQDLRKTFEENYGDVGRCYVKYNHNSDRTFATVDIKNSKDFNDALNDVGITHDGTDLQMKRFIDKKSNIRVPKDLNKINKSNIYVAGFNAGRKYGYNECLAHNRS